MTPAEEVAHLRRLIANAEARIAEIHAACQHDSTISTINATGKVTVCNLCGKRLHAHYNINPYHQWGPLIGTPHFPSDQTLNRIA